MVNRISLCLCATLLACSSDGDVPPPHQGPTGLDARELLVRASLDIRGVRPSPAELSQVAASPESLDALVAGFVDDPRFEARVRAIFADALRTRRDSYPFGSDDLGLAEEDELVLQQAIAEEPLHLIAHVALSDAPFSDILTADYTIVDPILLNVWPIEQLSEQPMLPGGVVMARYLDQRPAAGVLATNTFFWRHTSTVDNANRGRSNAISRAFLCEDYLERPIDFPQNVDLSDSESIVKAIRENPGCQACHATLDPFASHLWGFMYVSEDAATWLTYQPQNERMWTGYTGAEPAFFGNPTDGTLAGLAAAIGADERFVACTTRRAFEALVGRDATLEDEGQLAAHREAFLASNLSFKALVKSVLADPAYRGMKRQSDWGGSPEGTELKLASPELMSRTVRDLTGYTLGFFGRDAVSADFAVRALAGGGESGAATSPSLGHSLVQRRLAEGAAKALVEGTVDGIGAEPVAPSRVGRILAGEDLSEAPSAATLAALLLEIRSQSFEEDSEDVLALSALWREVRDETSPDEAWSAVLTTLLTDPELAVY